MNILRILKCIFCFHSWQGVDFRFKDIIGYRCRHCAAEKYAYRSLLSGVLK